MGRQPAQFVELGVEAIGDDAAVALQYWRMLDDRFGKERCAVTVDAELGGERDQPRRVQGIEQAAKFRQCGQTVAQCGKIARPCRAQRDAGQDALEIADTAERFTKRRVRAAFEQRLHRVVAFAEHALVA